MGGRDTHTPLGPRELHRVILTVVHVCLPVMEQGIVFRIAGLLFELRSGFRVGGVRGHGSEHRGLLAFLRRDVALLITPLTHVVRTGTYREASSNAAKAPRVGAEPSSCRKRER